MCISHDTALNSHSIVGRPPVLHLLRQHRWTAVAFLRPKAKVRTGKSWEWYGFIGFTIWYGTPPCMELRANIWLA